MTTKVVVLLLCSCVAVMAASTPSLSFYTQSKDSKNTTQPAQQTVGDLTNQVGSAQVTLNNQQKQANSSLSKVDKKEAQNIIVTSTVTPKPIKSSEPVVSSSTDASTTKDIKIISKTTHAPKLEANSTETSKLAASSDKASEMTAGPTKASEMAANSAKTPEMAASSNKPSEMVASSSKASDSAKAPEMTASSSKASDSGKASVMAASSSKVNEAAAKTTTFNVPDSTTAAAIIANNSAKRRYKCILKEDDE